MYSEAIKLFEDVGQPTNDDNVKLLATQIYNNRAACFMSLKQHSSVVSDTTIVLDKLDPSSQKALWRRGFAHKAANTYDAAIRDFQKYEKQFGKDAEVTKAMNESMKLLVQKQR